MIKTLSKAGKSAALPCGHAGVHRGIVELLDAVRQAAALRVNALMKATYWEIGRRIVEAEQKGRRRAGYGELRLLQSVCRRVRSLRLNEKFIN